MKLFHLHDWAFLEGAIIYNEKGYVVLQCGSVIPRMHNQSLNNIEFLIRVGGTDVVFPSIYSPQI